MSYLKLPYLQTRRHELMEPVAARLVADARIAISIAQKTRRTWRRKRPSARRTYEIMSAFDGLTDAMEPLEKRIRKEVYRSRQDPRLHQASVDIQREKRKLYKMVPYGTLSSKWKATRPQSRS